MRYLLVLVVSLVCAGCAAQRSETYSGPQARQVESQIVLDQPFEETWDTLVRNLSKDFFVINNIEKASRIINVSFSTDNPEDFVDCGRSARQYTSPLGGQIQHYNYDSAADTQFMTATDDGFPWLMVRKTEMDGRANIYVAPADKDTELSVNVRYILTIDVQGQGFNKYEKPVLGATYSNTYTVRFDTNRPTKTDGEKPGCATKGELETRILQAARG